MKKKLSLNRTHITFVIIFFLFILSNISFFTFACSKFHIFFFIYFAIIVIMFYDGNAFNCDETSVRINSNLLLVVRMMLLVLTLHLFFCRSFISSDTENFSFSAFVKCLRLSQTLFSNFLFCYSLLFEMFICQLFIIQTTFSYYSFFCIISAYFSFAEKMEPKFKPQPRFEH